MIWMSNKGLCTKLNQPSKLHQLPVDQGVSIVIPPRSPVSVPEPIGVTSDCILHQWHTANNCYAILFCLISKISTSALFILILRPPFIFDCQRILWRPHISTDVILKKKKSSLCNAPSPWGIFRTLIGKTFKIVIGSVNQSKSWNDKYHYCIYKVNNS